MNSLWCILILALVTSLVPLTSYNYKQHTELMLEDELSDFQGNIHSKWYCSKKQLDQYIKSILHPVKFKQTLFCKLPSHDFATTYNSIIIEEVEDLQCSWLSFLLIAYLYRYTTEFSHSHPECRFSAVLIGRIATRATRSPIILSILF